jgi:hypothetical protein
LPGGKTPFARDESQKALHRLYLPPLNQRVHGSSPCAPTIEINWLRNISKFLLQEQNRKGSTKGNKQ